MSLTPDATPILAMRGISKRFAGVQALRDVDVEVHSGEVVALLGENGAGKSTLMKVLGGIHQPDTGEILRDGKAVTIRSVSDSIRLGISFIHQELNVLDNLDIAGNVFLGREPVQGGFLRLMDRERMVRETQPYLDQLGLRFPATLPLERLSLAQRQMVEIAKALSLKARVLIMDEPTSSLTLTETARLLAVVQELRSQGVGVVYISHRLDEVRQIADRVVGLRDGRNAGGLTREEITHERMVKLMVGRDLAPAMIPDVRDEPERPDLLTLRKLRTLRYPEKEVSFSVRKGEILGMSGLVGSGRSELAMAIFGVEPPLSGAIQMGAETLKIRSPKDAINKHIYLIPEDRRRSGLIVDMTIRENIALPALENFSAFGLVRRGEETTITTQAVKQLGVKTPSVDFLAKNLSGGNQQKVVIAKWLALSPKVVIFDEPTRGIDVGAKAEIYTLIRELAKQGVGVLVISSDMEEVLLLSDRVAVMHEGQITGILDRADCSEEAIMHLAVGGGDVSSSDHAVLGEK
ncbi:MAG: sugar ABC transporter ATP-binding protein [Fibrella sp.]|nr:sugar ABC transporter ATP-binding protein [Armatimonadota bacterium]